jgi:hypothetical protein
MPYEKTKTYQNVFNSPNFSTWDELTQTVPTGSNQIIKVGKNYIGRVAVSNGDQRYTLLGQDISDIGNAIRRASTATTSTAIQGYDIASTAISNAAKSISSSINTFDNLAPVKSFNEAIGSFGASLFKSDDASNTGDVTQFNLGAAMGLNGGLGNSVGTVVSDAAKTIGNATSVASKEIKEFIAPLNNVVDAISNIGEEFDKIIQDTFLGQIFGLKGPEILCTIFCIIVSLLSCSDRQKLYETIVQIRQGLKNANSVINTFNEITKTPTEVPLFNDKSIADNIKSLFGSEKIKGAGLDKFLNVPKSTQTKKITPSTFEIPQSVVSTIQTIVTILSVLAKGQITLPVGLSGSFGIWEFAKVVLSIIQGMIVQMLDEFLTKYIKKIEEMLKKMMPQICIGNLASAFINKIINALTQIKNFLLSQLKGLLGSMDGFGLKWKTFGWYFKEIQDLLAMLKALNLILKNFADLALACGITPCNKNPDPGVDDIANAIKNGELINQSNLPASLYPIDQYKPKTETTPELDRLSKTFKDLINNPDACTFKDGNGFCIAMPDLFADAPAQIKNMAVSPEFLSALGDAYTVYSGADSGGITVVYTYRLQGGE